MAEALHESVLKCRDFESRTTAMRCLRPHLNTSYILQTIQVFSDSGGFIGGLVGMTLDNLDQREFVLEVIAYLIACLSHNEAHSILAGYLDKLLFAAKLAEHYYDSVEKDEVMQIAIRMLTHYIYYPLVPIINKSNDGLEDVEQDDLNDQIINEEVGEQEWLFGTLIPRIEAFQLAAICFLDTEALSNKEEDEKSSMQTEIEQNKGLNFVTAASVPEEWAWLYELATQPAHVLSDPDSLQTILNDLEIEMIFQLAFSQNDANNEDLDVERAILQRTILLRWCPIRMGFSSGEYHLAVYKALLQDIPLNYHLGQKDYKLKRKLCLTAEIDVIIKATIKLSTNHHFKRSISEEDIGDDWLVYDKHPAVSHWAPNEIYLLLDNKDSPVALVKAQSIEDYSVIKDKKASNQPDHKRPKKQNSTLQKNKPIFEDALIKDEDEDEENDLLARLPSFDTNLVDLKANEDKAALELRAALMEHDKQSKLAGQFKPVMATQSKMLYTVIHEINREFERFSCVVHVPYNDRIKHLLAMLKTMEDPDLLIPEWIDWNPRQQIDELIQSVNESEDSAESLVGFQCTRRSIQSILPGLLTGDRRVMVVCRSLEKMNTFVQESMEAFDPLTVYPILHQNHSHLARLNAYKESLLTQVTGWIQEAIQEQKDDENKILVEEAGTCEAALFFRKHYDIHRNDAKRVEIYKNICKLRPLEVLPSDEQRSSWLARSGSPIVTCSSLDCLDLIAQSLFNTNIYSSTNNLSAVLDRACFDSIVFMDGLGFEESWAWSLIAMVRMYSSHRLTACIFTHSDDDRKVNLVESYLPWSTPVHQQLIEEKEALEDANVTLRWIPESVGSVEMVRPGIYQDLSQAELVMQAYRTASQKEEDGNEVCIILTNEKGQVSLFREVYSVDNVYLITDADVNSYSIALLSLVKPDVALIDCRLQSESFWANKLGSCKEVWAFGNTREWPALAQFTTLCQ